MRINQLPFRDGSAGSGGAWTSRTEPAGTHGLDASAVRVIRHYSTDMLAIPLGLDGGPQTQPAGADGVLVLSLGHGSVSDQGACNQMFRALGSDLYYSRKGGADIS